MITVRRARHEARRVLWKERFERFGHDVGEFVFLDPVPHIENEDTARAEHAARLRECLRLIGEEHDAELAHHRVKRFVSEGQLQRVRLTPLHRT